MIDNRSRMVEYGSFKRTSQESDSERVDSTDIGIVDDSFFYFSRSEEERSNKCWRIIAPVMIAIILMGGIAFILAQYFNTLYPTDRVQQSYHGPNTNVGEKNSHQNYTSDVQEIAIKTQYRYPECSLYHKCLSLEGLCCPTRDGIFLNCCH